MKRFVHSFIVIFLAASFHAVDAQSDRTTIRVKPEDIRSMSKIELKSGNKVFPKSYLYKTNRSSVIILPNIINDSKGKSHFIHKEISFDDVDYITIYNHKRKIRYSILGGVIGGLSAYFITDQLGNDNLRVPAIEWLGQTPRKGFIEPIVVGFLGAGIGIIIGEKLAPIRLSTREDKRELQRRLKQFSYR